MTTSLDLVTQFSGKWSYRVQITWSIVSDGISPDLPEGSSFMIQDLIC
jgi:hypothetical protein